MLIVKFLNSDLLAVNFDDLQSLRNLNAKLSKYLQKLK